jgi:hypothetical protein
LRPFDFLRVGEGLGAGEGAGVAATNGESPTPPLSAAALRARNPAMRGGNATSEYANVGPRSTSQNSQNPLLKTNLLLNATTRRERRWHARKGFGKSAGTLFKQAHSNHAARFSDIALVRSLH